VSRSVTQPGTSTPTTPTPTIVKQTLELSGLTLSIAISKQAEITKSLAITLGIDEKNVEIISITEIDARRMRRLLAKILSIIYEVKVQNEKEAASLEKVMKSSSFESTLASSISNTMGTSVSITAKDPVIISFKIAIQTIAIKDSAVSFAKNTASTIINSDNFKKQFMFLDTDVTCIAEAISSDSSTFASTSEQTIFLTYEATFRGSQQEFETTMMSSSFKTYLEQEMILAAGTLSLTTPTIIEAPEEPLTYEPLYQTCKNSTKEDEDASINNEKTKQYVFNGKARKPNEMSSVEWEHYFDICANQIKPKSIEAVVITDAVSQYMPILFIVLAVLGIIRCIYNKVFGVKLDKNDPDLIRRKELKKELITAQEDLEVAITIGDRAAEKIADEQIKALKKEQKNCE
jgi:hypothetical protein